MGMLGELSCDELGLEGKEVMTQMIQEFGVRLWGNNEQLFQPSPGLAKGLVNDH